MTLQMPEPLAFNIFQLLKYFFFLSGPKALPKLSILMIEYTKPILNTNVVLIMTSSVT